MNLRILVLLMMSLIGLRLWAAPSSLTVMLKSPRATTLLPPPQVSLRWTDPRTPSCMGFQFRQQDFRRNEQEMGWLEDRLLKKKSWSDEDRREWIELNQRELQLHREWVEQEIEITMSVARAALTPDEQKWIESRRYALDLQTPGLIWHGSDAAEPSGFHLELTGSALVMTSTIHLADFCGKPVEIHVMLLDLEGSPTISRCLGKAKALGVPSHLGALSPQLASANAASCE